MSVIRIGLWLDLKMSYVDVREVVEPAMSGCVSMAAYIGFCISIFRHCDQRPTAFIIGAAEGSADGHPLRVLGFTQCRRRGSGKPSTLQTRRFKSRPDPEAEK
jgi:hypothetical protein